MGLKIFLVTTVLKLKIFNKVYFGLKIDFLYVNFCRKTESVQEICNFDFNGETEGAFCFFACNEFIVSLIMAVFLLR